MGSRQSFSATEPSSYQMSYWVCFVFEREMLIPVRVSVGTQMFHSEVICVYKSSVLASLLYIQAISLDQSLSVNARKLRLVIFTADLPESNASCSRFSSTDFAHELIWWFPAAEKGHFVPTPLLGNPAGHHGSLVVSWTVTGRNPMIVESKRLGFGGMVCVGDWDFTGAAVRFFR